MNINNISPIIASVVSIGGIIFQIGKHSENLSSLGLKVNALEEKEKNNNKILCDMFGKICVFEEKFKEIDNNIKDIKNHLIK